MVLEYESLHLPQKLPSHVGKYTSTMDPLGYIYIYMTKDCILIMIPSLRLT